MGQQVSLTASPATNMHTHIDTIITVATVKSTAILVNGKVGGVRVRLMLDSGSSVSLTQSNALQGASDIQVLSAKPIQLVTASGDQLPIIQHVKATVQLGELIVSHEFVVVKTLVAPVILGVDFLHKHGFMLDFTHNPVMVSSSSQKAEALVEKSIAVAQFMKLQNTTFLKYSPLQLNQKIMLLMIVLFQTIMLH